LLGLNANDNTIYNYENIIVVFCAPSGKIMINYNYCRNAFHMTINQF
jgi:hypothetical protein